MFHPALKMGFKNRGWQGVTVFLTAEKAQLETAFLNKNSSEVQTNRYNTLRQYRQRKSTQSTILQITFLFLPSSYQNAIFKARISTIIQLLYYVLCISRLDRTTFGFNNLLNEELFVALRYFN